MKRHSLDTVSLVFGTIFVVLGAAFIGFTNPWRALLIDVDWSWLGPIALLVLGVVIILPLLRRNGSEREPIHPGTPPEDAYEELPPSPLS
jgi:hypothetical protein